MKGSEGIGCEACGSVRWREQYDFGTFRVIQCRECGLSCVRAGEPAEPDSLYDREYYESRKDYYFENEVTNPEWKSENESIVDFRRGLDLLEAHRNPRGSKLLDVGCALGVFLCLARERGWETCGVDISSYAAKYARETFGLRTQSGQLSELGFPDREFDAITLWDVFEHFPNPSSQLREIHRVLKDDGVVLLDTPNAEALIRRIAHLLYRVSRGKVSYPAQKLHHLFHLYYFSRDTVTRIVERNGFKVVRMWGKPIPLVKARGNRAERLVVKGFSLLEKALGMEYEIMVLLRKAV